MGDEPCQFGDGVPSLNDYFYPYGDGGSLRNVKHQTHIADRLRSHLVCVYIYGFPTLKIVSCCGNIQIILFFSL
jgi:hypothetical protein